jgi:hypothetical protein
MTLYGKLTITAPDGSSQTVELTKPVITFGRRRANDVHLDDPRVSRQHFRIECSEEGCYVVDMGSANGTYLNETRIERAGLSDGDTIQVGDYRLQFASIFVEEEAATEVVEGPPQTVPMAGEAMAGTLLETPGATLQEEIGPTLEAPLSAEEPAAPVVPPQYAPTLEQPLQEESWAVEQPPSQPAPPPSTPTRQHPAAAPTVDRRRKAKSGGSPTALVGLAALGVVAVVVLLIGLAVFTGLISLPFGGRGPTVEYILDSSVRMASTDTPPTRLEVARSSLISQLRQPGVDKYSSGLRVFGGGHADSGCEDTALLVNIQQRNSGNIANALQGVLPGPQIEGAPLGESIIQAIADVVDQPEPRTLVIVTGGQDTCLPDAGALIQQEIDRTGVTLEMYIIGYQVEPADEAHLTAIAQSVRGAQYTSAKTPDELNNILDEIHQHINKPSYQPNLPAPSETWVQHVVDTEVAGAIDVLSVDLDGDGDEDLVVAAGDGNTVYWFRNDGSHSPVEFTRLVIDDNVPGVLSLSVADLDGDRLSDVVAAGSAGRIAWWRQVHDGEDVTWERHDVDNTFAGANDVAVGDVDGDGRLDVIAAAAADLDVIRWWQNDGLEIPGFDMMSGAIYELPGAAGLAPVDINLDGALDFAAVSPESSVVWAENDGGDPPTFSQHIIANESVGPPDPQRIIAADMNGDGMPDLIVSDPDSGQIVLFLNLDGGDTWQPVPLPDLIPGVLGLAASDVDGDGDLDLFSTTDSSQGGGFMLWRNDGGDPPTFSPTSIADPVDDYRGAAALAGADIDGDGDIDLAAVARSTDTLVWLERVGAGAGVVPSGACGDRVVGEGEECESDANCAEDEFCNSECQCEERGVACGDGVVVGDEECEPAPTFCEKETLSEDEAAKCAEFAAQCPTGEVCNSGCKCEPECGDDICHEDETPETCPDDCPAVCGDDLITRRAVRERQRLPVRPVLQHRLQVHLGLRRRSVHRRRERQELPGRLPGCVRRWLCYPQRGVREQQSVWGRRVLRQLRLSASVRQRGLRRGRERLHLPAGLPGCVRRWCRHTQRDLREQQSVRFRATVPGLPVHVTVRQR